jgi:redox-sensitive bicupin YhaK (pirin superfamily)
MIEIVEGIPTIEGAGVRLNRVFGHAQDHRFDPFLLLDHFRSSRPADYVAGFPWHPHRGIETVTYMLDGRVEHTDSLGNQGSIDGGDLQWMSASSGILHQEMPQAKEGVLEGLQLWVNLPARLKMAVPAYRDLRSPHVPAVRTPEGAKVRVVAGTFQGQAGPVKGIPVDPTYLDVQLPPEAPWEVSTPIGYTGFVYVLAGAASFGRDLSREIHRGQGGLFGPGEVISARAGSGGSRFLFVSGRPLREPIAWYGPIVMNTQQQLLEALADLRHGRFIRHQQPLVE